MTEACRFSSIYSTFHEIPLPENDVYLAGYAELIQAFNLDIPIPRTLAAISKKHKKYEQNRWKMFTPRHQPNSSLFSHLIFALKYEGINLTVLKALFDKINPQDIVAIVKKEPTGSYSRRIWFLYEWLQGKELELVSTSPRGVIIDVLDDKLQYSGLVRFSKRHRVRNNLPGIPGFCPLIWRTPKLEAAINLNLKEKTKKNFGSIHPDILLRAASFLLLNDSKASYAIEGESPSRTRTERWAKAIGQAGKVALSRKELERLQEIVISDRRFVKMGYRREGGFIGVHDRTTNLPIPEHISAKWDDLSQLMDSLIEVNYLLKDSSFDPILATTLVAFGFVFIHPFEDGNGRLHRYLLHHVLAETGFTPKGIVFPISAVILKKIEQYRRVLEEYSRPRLEFIEWRPTEKGNIEVLNETINLYRYFDATKQAEFLYDCVQETIEKTLPEEVSYLQKYDELKAFLNSYIDMPDRLITLLIQFLNQGQGELSKRVRKKEFQFLTEREIQVIESKYTGIFDLEDKQYIAQITVKNRIFHVQKKFKINKYSPYFREEIDFVLGRAVEKILENHKLDVDDINSINYGSSSYKHVEGQVLEVKIFKAEIKTKNGNTYSLEEYTYPEI